MAQKQERSRETEAAIMRAAMKLTLHKDASRITIREICAEAGVSVGAFYHHFSSRQELFHRSFESFDRELIRRMSLHNGNKSSVEALTDLLLFQTTFVANEVAHALPHYYCAMLTDPDHAAVSPDRAYYRAVHSCIHRLAQEGLLRPDCAPAKAAELCITFIRGCLVDWCLHEQRYNVVEHTRSVLPILLRGLLQDPI